MPDSSKGLRSQFGSAARPFETALLAVGVSVATAFGMAVYHQEFGGVPLPFDVHWAWYVLGTVALTQALRIPRLSWRRRAGAFCTAVGVSVVLLGLGPTLVCGDAAMAGCATRLDVSPLLLVGGIGLLSSGMYLDLDPG